MATPVGATAPARRHDRAQRRPLTAPAAGPVSGTVTLAANASDDRGDRRRPVPRSTAPTPATEDTSAPYSTELGQRDRHARLPRPHRRSRATPPATARPRAAGHASPSPTPPRSSSTTRVILGLDEPTALKFTPDGRMLIAERDGTIWVAQPGATRVDPQPFLQLSSVARRLRARAARPRARSRASPANGHALRLLHARDAAAQSRLALRRLRQQRTRLAPRRCSGRTAAAADIYHQGGDLELRARRDALLLRRRPPRRRPAPSR